MLPKSIGDSNPLSSVISSFVAILDIYIIFYMYTYKQNGELGYLYLDICLGYISTYTVYRQTD